MPLQFVSLNEDLAGAIREFNRRIEPAGATPLCEEARQSWLPTLPGEGIFEEHRFAYDGADVRGGYVLRHLDLSLNGETVTAAGFGQPTSEGIVNVRYKLIGFQVLRDAERRQPLLFGTGMGGWDEPVTKLLQSAGWKVTEVPFYMKVLRPGNLLRTAPALRRTPLRRIAAAIASATGAAWLAAKALDGWAALRGSGRRLETEIVPAFGAWTNEVWETCRGAYSLVGRRDSGVLRLLYPEGDARFVRLRLHRDGVTVGWAVLMDVAHQNHSHLGDARAGLIVDCLAPPADAPAVIAASVAELRRRGVDLIRSHQTHPAWGGALRRAGFLPLSSYFLLGLSPALAKRLDESDPERRGLHVNRGDGDGPKYL